MAISDDGKWWARAWRYIDNNQTAPARATLELILSKAPADVRARVLLAATYATDDRPRMAVEHVRLALAQPCEDAEVLLQLARLATRVGEVTGASSVLRRGALADCSDPDTLVEAAQAWQTLGDNVAALASLERARRVGADSPGFHFYRGVQLGFNGRLTDAGREFERCIQYMPPMGHAFLQLARLRHQNRAHNHVTAIRRALGAAAPAGEDRAALQFALYQELEDLGEYVHAWEALATANALVHAASPYDARVAAATFERMRHFCDADFLADHADAPFDGPLPIFVIGLPRSGTTVLERILGNHSQVESAGELGAFLRALSYAVRHFVPVAQPDSVTLDRLPAVDWPLVARRYLEQSQWRARGKPFYVDKLPRNWMVAGLIHKAFPRAPILNLVRDPMGVCFSNWRAHLGAGPDYAYAYDLDALAEHHAHYRQVMRHWHAAMPGVILDVDYGHLVREPEAVAREVFAFCRLPYERGCTDLARNPAPSATLSMAQVRQPIHANAADAWRPYVRELEGLRARLAADCDAERGAAFDGPATSKEESR